ncbi:hypothetical protein D3C81_55490 [compost metagenome]
MVGSRLLRLQILFAGFIGVGDARLVVLFRHQGIAGKKISGSAMFIERSFVEMKGVGSEKRHLGLRCNPDGGLISRGRKIEIG